MDLERSGCNASEVCVYVKYCCLFSKTTYYKFYLMRSDLFLVVSEWRSSFIRVWPNLPSPLGEPKDNGFTLLITI